MILDQNNHILLDDQVSVALLVAFSVVVSLVEVVVLLSGEFVE